MLTYPLLTYYCHNVFEDEKEESRKIVVTDNLSSDLKPEWYLKMVDGTIHQFTEKFTVIFKNNL